MEAENKNNMQFGPIVGIGIIIIVLAIAGLFFYKNLMSGPIGGVDPEPVLVIKEQPEQKVEVDEPTEVLQPQAELAQLERELEEVTVDIGEDDLFGLEQLDAELIEFTELDELLNFEL